MRDTQTGRFLPDSGLPWGKVEKTDGCWLWKGLRDPRGYGRYAHDLAHRVFYRALYGAIPPALSIDHLCRVKNCVNPEHMEIVSLEENTRRANTKDVCVRGHVLDSDSTYQWRGIRQCRPCNRERASAYRERRKQLAVQV